MVQMIRCKGCLRYVPGNPRIKNQDYCKRTACQNKRKGKWESARIASDPGYKASREKSKAKSRKKNPGYWVQRRARNPDYCERNRELQKKRDQKRRERKARNEAGEASIRESDALSDKRSVNTICFGSSEPDLAKTDTLNQLIGIKPGIYEIAPENCDLAKTDALKAKYLIIPAQYIDLANTDTFDFQKFIPYPPGQTKTPKEADDENRKETHQTGSYP